jgi:hypothetical protein
MILVMGYYDKFNLGDEAYKIAFPLIIKDHTTDIRFENPKNLKSISENTSIIIVGGGDVINDWFNEEFKRLLDDFHGPVYAVSIGITYKSTLNDKYLGKYNQIYVRHKAYSNELTAIKQTDNVFHIPDIAFCLPIPAALPKPALPIIGVFLANGVDVRNVLKPVLSRLSIDYEIILYSFNTSPESHESDVLHAAHCYSEYKQGPILQDPLKMLEEMSRLHFAICVRYHSNIFSIMRHIPFISIAHTQKVKFLLEDHDLKNYYNTSCPNESLDDLVNHYINEPQYSNLKDKLAKIHSNSVKVLSTLKLFNNTKKSIQQINDECVKMIKLGEKPELVASHAIYHITKSVNNKYFYGFVENLKDKTKDIFEMLKWLFEDFNNKHPKGVKFLQNPDEFTGVHRSGWEYVTELLRQFQSPSGILTDLYVDGTFHWNEELYQAQGIIPFKQSWIGFIHHTSHPSYNEYNLQNLFKKDTFLLSLQFCKGLITLSENNRVWVERKLLELEIKVPVFRLFHPTEYSPVMFQPFSFTADPRFVQIGSWLRDPYAIYYAPFSFGKKHILIGKNMDNIVHPESLIVKIDTSCGSVCDNHVDINHRNAQVFCDCYKYDNSQTSITHHICRPHRAYKDEYPASCGNTCIQFILRYLWKQQAPARLTVLTNGNGCSCNVRPVHYSQQSQKMRRDEANVRQLNNIIKRNYQSVTSITRLDNDDYDKLLASHVVFLKLEDASAVNTIIECIIRNTPVIVNRLPATVEYLGSNYPLFYDHVHEVSKFTTKDIQAAYKYLSKMNKTPFVADTFVAGFKAILNQI